MFSEQGCRHNDITFRHNVRRRLAGFQYGGHNSGVVRKHLYFWLYAGQQNNFEGYLYISEVQQHGATSLETVTDRRGPQCAYEIT